MRKCDDTGSERPALSVVIPTYNESDNVGSTLDVVEKALSGVPWEVIFVDDESTDGTGDLIRQHAARDRRVRLIQRLGKRDLSSACIEGMLAAVSPYVAVMHADLQPDAELLPKMLECLRRDNVELVVGSRRPGPGGNGTVDRGRRRMGRVAAWLSGKLLNAPLSDPLSGFFMVRSTLIRELHPKLYGRGSKILLDIYAAAPAGVRHREMAYTARARRAGYSKTSYQVAAQYLWFLLSRSIGRVIPVEFLLFSAVGLSGVGVHMGVLTVLHYLLDMGFILAQIIATFAAMNSNFVLNNRITFREHRLYGRKFFRGLLSFYAVCTVGAVIGNAVGDLLFHLAVPWWLAGLATTFVSALWNFSMSAMFTWRAFGMRR